MVSFKESIAALKVIRPQRVFLTAKSGAGKTYLSDQMKAYGYQVLELDKVVMKVANQHNISNKGGAAFSMYKSGQPEAVMKAFVKEIHAFFDKHTQQPVIIEGAISDANLINRIFSGPYSVFTFIFLYPTNTKAYAGRMMKRFKDEKKRGVRSLSIWPEVTPELEAAPFNSPKLTKFMTRMANESKIKSKERYEYFERSGFIIYRINV